MEKKEELNRRSENIGDSGNYFIFNLIYKYRMFIVQAYYTSITSYRQTLVSPGKLEGHSFDDHVISELVSVMPSSVTEASIALCSLTL
jgi:hypothetical protein